MASEYLDFPQVVTESACAMLNNPGVLSDFVIAETLEHGRAKDINFQDAKELIKDYLNVLCKAR